MDKTKTIRAERPAARLANAPLLIVVDRRTRVPLQRQIYAAIRDAILSGRLGPHARVPASRELANDLKVSRTTIVHVYEQLETEGYIVGRGSAGSFVSGLAIDRGSQKPAKKALTPGSNTQHAEREIALARAADGLQHIRVAPLPFRLGEPALELFPARQWARLYARRARRSGATLLGYGDAAGYAPLREAIAAYVSAARGVNANANQVVLTRGTQQAIHLAARALLLKDDSVWVEDPGYLAARALLTVSGAAVVPIPVDSDGLMVAHGVTHFPRARAAYVCPSHHFPLGVTMSLPRRLELLAWAARAGAWILEDDFDSEFRYTGAPIPSLQGLDTMDRVIYMGTFSKTMFPALRLGYMIVPDALIELFRAVQATLDHIAPSVEQATLAEFIGDGHFARHVRRMKSVYASRQQSLLRGIGRELDGVMQATATETGMHLIGWLNDKRMNDAAVSKRAWNAGVEASPLSKYAVQVKLPPALVMGFAAVRPMEMGAALRALRRVITP